MTSPLLSVIIPTYGRETVLCDTLDDVLKQDYPSVEVLVVDQTKTHTPETQRYLDDLVERQAIRLFSLPWASLPGARNYAIRRSHGDLLLFLDDDVQLPPGFLSAHVQAFQEHPNAGAIAGRVFDRMKLADADPDLIIDFLPPEAMDPGIAWYHIDLVHTTQPQQVLTARGCNMAFRRVLFDQHGLAFDERFRGSAVREESDFCLRIRNTGYHIWYAPSAHLVHLGEESGGCHDISTRSIAYQITFYHNHFLMGLKNLTLGQNLRFFAKLFDCHVLGHPPCYKSGSPIRVITRFMFYIIGFLQACGRHGQTRWNDGQQYTHQDALERLETMHPSSGHDSKANGNCNQAPC
ncbi:MAG: hormogonium polysaccharide biosynthesis glycosyltransferase HpsN [Cyanobacteria bacterium P01_E01_bin.6]